MSVNIMDAIKNNLDKILLVVAFIVGVYFVTSFGDNQRYFDIANETFNYFSGGEITNYEYPPGARLFILIPRLFTSDPEIYGIIYAIMIAIVTCIFFILIYQFSKKMNKPTELVMVLAIVTTVMMSWFFFISFDIIVATIVLLSFYCYYEKKYTLAFILIALGAMVKIYPVFVAPILLIPFVVKKQYVDAGKYFLTCVAVCLAIVLLFYFNDIGASLDFFIRQSDRGVEFGSLAGSLLFLLSPFIPVSVVSEFGSWDMISDHSDFLSSISFFIIAITILLAYYFFFRYQKSISDKKDDFNIIALFSILVILLFMIFNKVGTPDYWIWILTLSLFLIVPQVNWKYSVVTIVVCTIFVHLQRYSAFYPKSTFEENVLSMDFGLYFLILMKNIMLILTLILTTYTIKKSIVSQNIETDNV